MKLRITLFMIFSLSATHAFAEDLMSLGEPEKDQMGNAYTPFLVTDIDSYVKSLPYPNSKNREDYVNYFSKYVDKTRTNLIAKAAQAYPHTTQIGPFSKLVARCISHPEAYTITYIPPVAGKVANNTYELQCIAGKDKNATHVLQYRFIVNSVPKDCATAAKIRAHFTIVTNQTAAAAQVFDYGMRTGKGCGFLPPVPAIPGHPIVRSLKLKKGALEKLLAKESKQDLKHFLLGDKESTDGEEAHKFSNPFECGLGDCPEAAK